MAAAGWATTNPVVDLTAVVLAKGSIITRTLQAIMVGCMVRMTWKQVVGVARVPQQQQQLQQQLSLHLRQKGLRMSSCIAIMVMHMTRSRHMIVELAAVCEEVLQPSSSSSSWGSAAAAKQSIPSSTTQLLLQATPCRDTAGKAAAAAVQLGTTAMQQCMAGNAALVLAAAAAPLLLVTQLVCQGVGSQAKQARFLLVNPRLLG
jgi:hypothetical protein